jgi:regulator of telomere elongation helicase 1
LYYNAIFRDTRYNGAVLMGVCRGKISEGMDFSDRAARCVIVVGVPYAQMSDPKVVLKKDYLDKKCKSNRSSLDGD